MNNVVKILTESESIELSEKVVEWFNKPGTQAFLIIGGLVLGCALGYQFIIKPLIRKARR